MTFRQFARSWGPLVVLAILAVFVVVFTPNEDDDSGGGGGRSGPGLSEVYDDIAAISDCGELQAGFDRNMDDAERRQPGTHLRDVVLSYADAYDDRMRDLGCYR